MITTNPIISALSQSSDSFSEWFFWASVNVNGVNGRHVGQSKAHSITE